MKKKSLNIGSLKISKEKISNLHTIKGGAGDTEDQNQTAFGDSCQGICQTGLFGGNCITFDLLCDRPNDTRTCPSVNDCPPTGTGVSFLVRILPDGTEVCV